MKTAVEAWSKDFASVLAGVLIFAFGVGCADDSVETHENDTAAEDVAQSDLGVSDATNFDSMFDAESEDEKCELLEACSCRRNEDCARGSVCQAQDSTCTAVTGCILVDAAPEDQGCYYDHHRPLVPYAGYFTYAECESDSECDDENPYCIDRVCHFSSRCDEDDDCGDGQRCYRSTICADEDRF